MKTKAFLTSLINFAFSIGLLVLNYILVRDIPPEANEGRLGLIVVLPILIVTAILNLTTIITTIISSSISIGSESKAIKVISIILLLLTLGFLVIFGYLTYTTIKIL